MTIIDWAKFDVAALHASFQAAEPFEHIVIDNFIDSDIAAATEADLRHMPDAQWVEKSTEFGYINQQQDTLTQSKKVALTVRAQIPPRANAVIDLFQSPEMRTFLTAVTGIEHLQADEALVGGGIHKTTTGGHLAIHADYNLHPTTLKHRRVNALLFMNSDWKQQHNGALELWSKDMQTLVRSVEPLCNRLVVFRITDDAYHGHPLPWTAPFPRLSFAFYYFTDDRPEHEKAPFHWAAWQRRYEGEF